MKKILVVDDSESIQMLYQIELEREGFEVKIVSGGKEAIQILESFNPDLIVLDIEMPDLNGLEVLSIVRNTKQQLPVILCTAYPDYKHDLKTWGSEAFVTKSSDLSPMKEEIKRLLNL